MNTQSNQAAALARAASGQQRYHVTVPGTASAALLSVVSFEAVEKLGEPYRITIQLTHPQELQRADYLGKDAGSRITPSAIDALSALARWHHRHRYYRRSRSDQSYQNEVARGMTLLSERFEDG
ncbi:hypothetical protein [Herbaspirillum sp. RV1423]|uniref:hypothetical protein n=1 Tax=Herbaspirillum sp. RV1423 TaxID=1443993 RepID=UPI0004B5F9B5